MGFDSVVVDVVQIIGALVVLACFLPAQVEWIDPDAYYYLLPNLAGSVALTATAAVGYEWGFVFLEGVWALVSAWGVVRRLRGIAPKVVQ